MTRSKCIVAIALFSAIACVTTNSFAQEKAETSPPPSNQQSVANLITQSVVKLGVFSCAERVEQVTSYLGFGPDTVVTIRTPKQPANKRSLSIAMDIPSVADNAMAFADFYPKAGGCSATYHLIFTAAESCVSVREKRFPNVGQLQNLSPDLDLLTNQSGLRVFLKYDQDYCLVTKTETIEN